MISPAFPLPILLIPKFIPEQHAPLLLLINKKRYEKPNIKDDGSKNLPDPDIDRFVSYKTARALA